MTRSEQAIEAAARICVMTPEANCSERPPCERCPYEWQSAITDDTPCFINGCDYTDIDVRGPIMLRDDPTPYYACIEHWEVIMAVLGRQTGSDDEHRWDAAQGDAR